MDFSPAYLLAITQIIWIDLLLSGDNAVVIALACRSLPEKQRRIGILLGAGAAVGLRIAFAFVITQILGIPFLKALGGVLLMWIAIKLIIGEKHEDQDIPASDRLWKAVGTIAMADAVMSLDNVVAIAAIARDDYSLFVFGLAPLHSADRRRRFADLRHHREVSHIRLGRCSASRLDRR